MSDGAIAEAYERGKADGKAESAEEIKRLKSENAGLLEIVLKRIEQDAKSE